MQWAASTDCVLSVVAFALVPRLTASLTGAGGRPRSGLVVWLSTLWKEAAHVASASKSSALHARGRRGTRWQGEIPYSSLARSVKM